jgi:hypothetical protein
MAPGLLDLLKEKMKAQGTKIGSLATASLAAGAGAATALPKRQWASLTSKDQYGNATGAVSMQTQKLGKMARTGKYMPWQLRGTYKKAQERRNPDNGGQSNFMSFADKSQEKLDMVRHGYPRMTKADFKKQYGYEPDFGRGRGHEPSVNNPNPKSASAGQGRDATLPPSGGQPGGGQPGGGQPKGPQSPMLPGGFGAAKGTPQQKAAMGGGAAKTPAQQQQGPGKMSINGLSELKIGSVGRVSMPGGGKPGGGEGGPKPGAGIPVGVPTLGKSVINAGKAAGQGFIKIGQAEQEMAKEARATAQPVKEGHGGEPQASADVQRNCPSK